MRVTLDTVSWLESSMDVVVAVVELEVDMVVLSLESMLEESQSLAVEVIDKTVFCHHQCW